MAPGIHDSSCRAVWRNSWGPRCLHGRHRTLRRVALTLAEDYGLGERNGGTGGGTIDQAQVGDGSEMGGLALWDLWGMRIG